MENKQRDTVYGYVRMNYNGQQNMVNDIIHIIFQYYLIILESVILEDSNDIDTFYDLLSPKLLEILSKDKFELRLLYRNSRDGNSAQSFHKHCNGHTNTLTLVQSNYGHIFGGFTSKDWGLKINGYIEDDTAFLYLIKSKFNHEPKIYQTLKGNIYSVYIHPTNGPTWGGGHALVLQSTYTNGPYSNLGWNNGYEGTGNVLCGGDHYKTNINTHRFEIIEYEVFVVE